MNLFNLPKDDTRNSRYRNVGNYYYDNEWVLASLQEYFLGINGVIPCRDSTKQKYWKIIAQNVLQCKEIIRIPERTKLFG